MLTAEELDSISKSFDESLRSRLWGLSPASISLPWLSSAIDAITFAHSTARSLIYQLKLDSGVSLSSWYSGDSLKVLGICNCISAEIERLFLRHQKLRIAIRLLHGGTPSEENTHEARDLLAEWECEGNVGHVKSDIEELIRDLDVSIGKPVPTGKVSPVERVVDRTIRVVGFLTWFVTRIVSSALRSSLRAVVCVSIPEEFPWGDPIRAIEAAIIVEPPESDNELDGNLWLLKELEEVEASMKELYDVDASVRGMLETFEYVAASGDGGETLAMLREAVFGLEETTEALSEGLSRLREGVNELLLTVTRMRKEMNEFF